MPKVEDPEKELIRRYGGKGIKEILHNPAPNPVPILGQNILLKEAKVCVYAKEKVGKSVFATQLGLCCASGQPFLDIPVINKVNVMYLNFEINDYMFEQRILQIKDILGLKYVPAFRKLTLQGEHVPLLDTEAGYKQVVDILFAQISQGLHVDLVIWDCRYKSFGLSELEDSVMKKWCRHMDNLIRDLEFTPVIVHHEGKNTKGVGAGSSVFDRWVNTAIWIKPHHWIAPLRPSKERNIIVGGNYTSGHEIHTVMEYPIHRIGGSQVWQESKSKKEQAADFIIETMNDAGGKMSQEELLQKAKGKGFTESTFVAAKGELENIGHISSRQNPDKAGRHNIVDLTWLTQQHSVASKV